MAFNIVEFIQDEDADCAWDQPCKFGHRVEGHAVYCHNDDWRQSPSKCRRDREGWKHEDCPGFAANPDFNGDLIGTVTGEPCNKCWGFRTVVDNGGRKTCARCDGYGVEPMPVDLTEEEAGMLERCALDWDRQAVIPVVNEKEHASIRRLLDAGLYNLLSITSVGKHSAYLVEPTGRGRAAIRFFWDRSRKSGNGQTQGDGQ